MEPVCLGEIVVCYCDGSSVQRKRAGVLWSGRAWWFLPCVSTSVYKRGKLLGHGNSASAEWTCLVELICGLKPACPVAVLGALASIYPFSGVVSVCGDLFISRTLGRWLNGSIRPVLKHGPRSLTYVRVHGWWNLLAKWKWLLGSLHQQPTNQLREVWVWAYVLGPERWWTMPVKGKTRGNSGGGS